MNSYSQNQQDFIFEFPADPCTTYDYETISNFLNTEFRSFKDALIELINKKALITIENHRKYIDECCKNTNVRIASKNTLDGWFLGTKRPKKGDADRERMFALSFALKLSTQETEDLFNKVYLDRSFNHRNYKELIYYYCIGRGYTYEHAQKLISMVNIDTVDHNDSTIYTRSIKEDVQSIIEDSVLLRYIETHKHNLSLNNRRASELLEKYKELSYGFVSYEKVDRKSRHKDSASALYVSITGRENITGAKGTKTIKFKSNTVPDEIKTNFPQMHNFTDKVQSYEELRKTLILIYSYWWWNMLEKNNYEYFDKDNLPADIFDGYKDDLNNILLDANMAPLDLGNPYDWMFCYCTYTDSPLDTFRSMMDEMSIE